MSSSHEVILNDHEIRLLRNAGVLSDQEIGLKVGDLIIAENVVSKNRRVLNNISEVLVESKQQLLKD